MGLDETTETDNRLRLEYANDASAQALEDHMKNFVLAFVTFCSFIFAAATARAETFSTDIQAIGGATIDPNRLRSEVQSRADTLLDGNPIVIATASEVARVTTITVTVVARHISPDDAQRLREAIGAAMRLRRVVETVRFGGPKR